MVGCGSRITSRRAFSLLDILVSIGVIALLLAIMLPSMSHVSEATKRVLCRSNVRQVGLGLTLYAEERQDALPPSMYSNVLQPGAFLPQQMTALLAEDANHEFQWDGLGLLFSKDYLPTPEIFYCPSHRGMHTMDYYADHWADRAGAILGNYHYRALAPSDRYLHQLNPFTALVADSMREVPALNHRHGVNILRADMSVAWYADAGETLLAEIPDAAAEPTAAMDVARAWWLLETGSIRGFPDNQPWLLPVPTLPANNGSLVDP
jgi:type II secretory pathway pseudopilin PulG